MEEAGKRQKDKDRRESGGKLKWQRERDGRGKEKRGEGRARTACQRKKRTTKGKRDSRRVVAEFGGGGR